MEVLKLSRRHHKLVNKEFQEEMKQEQGKYDLSEQLCAGQEGTISWKKKKICAVNKKKVLLQN